MTDKFDNLLRQLKDAYARFEEVMQKKKTMIIRDSAIQRFEFTFELIWKTLKAYLQKQGAKELFFPRDVLKSAYQAKLIEDNPQWLKMLETRNLTSHLYKESMAEQAYASFKNYLPLIKELIERLS